MFYLMLIVCGSVVSLAVGAWLFAPWVPTRQRDLERIGNLLSLTPTDIVYDLGCGDGRVLFYLSKRFKVRSVGVEIGIPLIIWCWLKKLLLRADRTTFLWKNFFNVDVSDASVVYLFGLPVNLAEKMVSKLKRELKPGARIVSYVFTFKGLNPERVDKPTPNDLSIYIYRV